MLKYAHYVDSFSCLEFKLGLFPTSIFRLKFIVLNEASVTSCHLVYLFIKELLCLGFCSVTTAFKTEINSFQWNCQTSCGFQVKIVQCLHIVNFEMQICADDQFQTASTLLAL